MPDSTDSPGASRLLPDRPLRELLTAYDVLAISSGIWFMVLFVRYLLPPLFPHIQDVYGVGSAETGLLLTVLMTCYALMQFPSGALSDRFGRDRVITASTVSFSAAALVVATPGGFGLLLVGVALVGLGTGAFKTVVLNHLAEVYPRQAGQTIGFMDTVGQFGGVLAPALVVALLSRSIGWRSAFVAAAFVGFGLAVVSHRRIAGDGGATDGADRSPADDATEQGDGLGEAADGPDDAAENAAKDAARDAAEDAAAAADRGRDSSYLDAFLNPTFTAVVVVSMLFTVAWGGLTAFLPLYLIEQKGFAPGLANLVYGGLFVMTLSQPLTGWLGDRTGKLPVLTAVVGLGGVGILGLLVADSVLVAVVGTFAFGAGFHGFRPVRSSYLVEAIADAVGGGTLGIVRTLVSGCAAVSPVAVGIVADRYDYPTAFELIGVSVGLAVALAVVVVVADFGAAGSGRVGE